MLNKRLVSHSRALAYVRIQAVGMTNWHIKKGVTNCRIKRMGMAIRIFGPENDPTTCEKFASWKFGTILYSKDLTCLPILRGLWVTINGGKVVRFLGFSQSVYAWHIQ